MLKIQNKEVSPDLKEERQERDALLGEKNNLQSEMVSLGQTNKRVKKEIKDLEEKRELAGKQFDALREAIEGHVALKESVQQEIKDLNGQYAYRKSVLEASLPDVKLALADLQRQKQPIQSEIDGLYLVKKESQKSLEKIEEEIKERRSLIIELNTSVEHKTFQEGLLRKSIDNYNKELESLEDKVSKNKAIIDGIEKRGILLSKINKDIEEAENKFILRRGEIKKFLEVESEDLKKEIEKNKAINEQEKALHISLMSKKQVLDNKEAFIKGQYIRAGLKYEEN